MNNNGKLNAPQLHPSRPLSKLSNNSAFNTAREASRCLSNGNSTKLTMKENKMTRNLKSTSMIMLDIKSNNNGHHGSSGGSGASESPRSSSSSGASSSSFEDDLDAMDSSSPSDSNDSNEELEYGPGIVAKLTNKFLKYSLKTTGNSTATENGLIRRSQFRSHHNLTHCSSLENLLSSPTCNRGHHSSSHSATSTNSNSSGEEDDHHQLSNETCLPSLRTSSSSSNHHHLSSSLLKSESHQQPPIPSTRSTSKNVNSHLPQLLLTQNNQQLHHQNSNDEDKKCIKDDDDAGETVIKTPKLSPKKTEGHDPVLHSVVVVDQEQRGLSCNSKEADSASSSSSSAQNNDDDYDCVDMILDESSSQDENEVFPDDEINEAGHQTGNQGIKTSYYKTTTASSSHPHLHGVNLDSKEKSTWGCSKQLDFLSSSGKREQPHLNDSKAGTTPVIKNLHLKSQTSLQPILSSSSSSTMTSTSTFSGIKENHASYLPKHALKTVMSSASSSSTRPTINNNINNSNGVTQQKGSNYTDDDDNTDGKSLLKPSSQSSLSVTTSNSSCNNNIPSTVSSSKGFIKNSSSNVIATPRSHQYHVGPLSSLTPVSVKKSQSLENVLCEVNATQTSSVENKKVTSVMKPLSRPLPPPPPPPPILHSNGVTKGGSLPPTHKPPILPQRQQGDKNVDELERQDVIPTPRVTAVVNPNVKKQLNHHVHHHLSSHHQSAQHVSSNRISHSLPALPTLPARSSRRQDHPVQPAVKKITETPSPLNMPSCPPPTLPSDTHSPPKVPLNRLKSSSGPSVTCSLSATAGKSVTDASSCGSQDILDKAVSSSSSLPASSPLEGLTTTTAAKRTTKADNICNKSSRPLLRGSTLPTVKPVIAQKPKAIKANPLDDIKAIVAESAANQENQHHYNLYERSLASSSVKQILHKSLKSSSDSQSLSEETTKTTRDPFLKDINSFSDSSRQNQHQTSPSGLEVISASPSESLTGVSRRNHQNVSPDLLEKTAVTEEDEDVDDDDEVTLLAFKQRKESNSNSPSTSGDLSLATPSTPLSSVSTASLSCSHSYSSNNLVEKSTTFSTSFTDFVSQLTSFQDNSRIISHASQDDSQVEKRLNQLISDEERVQRDLRPNQDQSGLFHNNHRNDDGAQVDLIVSHDNQSDNILKGTKTATAVQGKLGNPLSELIVSRNQGSESKSQAVINNDNNSLIHDHLRHQLDHDNSRPSNGDALNNNCSSSIVSSLLINQTDNQEPHSVIADHEEDVSLLEVTEFLATTATAENSETMISPRKLRELPKADIVKNVRRFFERSNSSNPTSSSSTTSSHSVKNSTSNDQQTVSRAVFYVTSSSPDSIGNTSSCLTTKPKEGKEEETFPRTASANPGLVSSSLEVGIKENNGPLTASSCNYDNNKKMLDKKGNHESVMSLDSVSSKNTLTSLTQASSSTSFSCLTNNSFTNSSSFSSTQSLASKSATANLANNSSLNQRDKETSCSVINEKSQAKELTNTGVTGIAVTDAKPINEVNNAICDSVVLTNKLNGRIDSVAPLPRTGQFMVNHTDKNKTTLINLVNASQNNNNIINDAATTMITKPVKKASQPNNSMVFDFRGKDVQPTLAIKSIYGRSAVISSDENDAPEDYSGSTDVPELSGVVFIGENEVIDNGILLKTRNKKLSLSFSSDLCTTFEYPSESCLLKFFDEEERASGQDNATTIDGDQAKQIPCLSKQDTLSKSSIQSNIMRGASSGLGSYKPTFLANQEVSAFELGVSSCGQQTNGHSRQQMPPRFIDPKNNQTSLSSNEVINLKNQQNKKSANNSLFQPQARTGINTGNNNFKNMANNTILRNELGFVVNATSSLLDDNHEDLADVGLIKPADSSQTTSWSTSSCASDLLF